MIIIIIIIITIASIIHCINCPDDGCHVFCRVMRLSQNRLVALSAHLLMIIICEPLD